MKKPGLVTKLAIYITSVVAIIFSVAMYLVYTTARDTIMQVELENEQIDLQHNSEFLDLLSEQGMPTDQLVLHARAPYDDGTYENVCDLVLADSVEAVTRRIKQNDPEVIVLKAALKDTPSRLVLLEKYHTNDHVEPAYKAMAYTIAYSFIILIMMGFAITLAIKFLLRPEMERRTRIDTELEIAKRLQEKMLPTADILKGAVSNVQLEALVRPAKEIGGDYYNVVRVRDELHFIIADVSGKGIPAAMFLMKLSELYLLVLSLLGKREPNLIAEELNERLHEGNSAYMFATAIIGRLNLNTGTLDLCAAGHEPPLIVTPEGEASFMTIDNDVPLGLVEGYVYKSHTSHLAEGSHLLLYTDGVTEAENERLELFGSNTLAQIMQGQAQCSPKQVVEELIKNIREFTGNQEQSDDITLLSIKRCRQPSQQTATLTLNNDLNELNRVLEMTDTMALPDSLTLALEEAFVNVVNYSHATTITVETKKQTDCLIVTITDDGICFDPTKHERKADDAMVDTNGLVKPGGEGINLIKKFVDDVRYQRTDHHNILTLIHYINKTI